MQVARIPDEKTRYGVPAQLSAANSGTLPDDKHEGQFWYTVPFTATVTTGLPKLLFATLHTQQSNVTLDLILLDSSHYATSATPDIIKQAGTLLSKLVRTVGCRCNGSYKQITLDFSQYK